MGRYFFHIDNGFDFLDEEGTELASPDHVLPLAMKMAATMMGEDESLWNGKALAVRVVGEAGNLVMRVQLKSMVIMPSDPDPS